MYFEPVSGNTVHQFVQNSDPKTCKLDLIPTSLLMERLDIVLPTITHIVNDSLNSGIFPQTHKPAAVKHMLKKPTLDHNNPKKFHPVSNLSFLSKIMGKIVLFQMSNHLCSNSLVNPFRSAYKPGHSTETALLEIANDLLLSFDNGNVSIVTYLDLSAVFDTTDHNILLSHLEHVFGIHSTALQCFSSYLANRTQHVSINNLKSDPAPVLYSVPQDYVLGPVLFVLYTTPLSDVTERHSIHHHSFADDTQLRKSAPPHHVSVFISWCFQPSQPQRITSRLKTNFGLSPSYSFNKLYNVPLFLNIFFNTTL